MDSWTNPLLTEFRDEMLGKKLGSGAFRDVYELTYNHHYVVKIEREGGKFHNILEWEMWNGYKYDKKISKWLAPCSSISNNGLVLIQERTEAISPSAKLPEKLPRFLTDIKRNNFGKLNGKLVCHDYAYVIESISDTPRKVSWR